MSFIWEIFKKLYEDAYDLPHFYLKIENELYCHVFTFFFLVAIFLGIALLIKILIGSKKTKKEKRDREKRIEKSILGILEERDKNKKKGNV